MIWRSLRALVTRLKTRLMLLNGRALSGDDVLESLQLLSLGSIAPKIPADLRSPETALALELFGALPKCLRSHPELLELQGYLEDSRLTDNKYCPEDLWPFDNMPAIYKLKNKPS